MHNYVASTLAHLPFTAANEDLNLIHQIDSIVAVEGNGLVDKISKSLIGLGWSDEGGDNEDGEGGEVRTKPSEERSYELIYRSSDDGAPHSKNIKLTHRFAPCYARRRSRRNRSRA